MGPRRPLFSWIPVVSQGGASSCLGPCRLGGRPCLLPCSGCPWGAVGGRTLRPCQARPPGAADCYHNRPRGNNGMLCFWKATRSEANASERSPCSAYSLER